MRYRPSRPWRWLLFPCVLVLVATSSCRSAEEAADPSGDSGTTVRFGVFNWDAARVTTEVIIEVTERYPELGVDNVELRENLDTSIGWVALGQGQVDALTEVALPNQEPLYEENKENTELLSTTYDEAKQGWWVPNYVVESGGAAEGLDSVTELEDYTDVFEGELYDGPRGWITTNWNDARLEGYGLAGSYEHVTASEAAYLAALDDAYNSEEPILLYLWQPHWAFAEYDLTLLEEPTPYKEGCLDGGDGACAMPFQQANIAAHSDLKEKAPEFYAFLEQFKFDVAELQELLADRFVREEPFKQIAKSWVDAHQDEVESWVQSATE